MWDVWLLQTVQSVSCSFSLFLAAIAALYLGSSLTDGLTGWLTGAELGQNYKLVKTTMQQSNKATKQQSNNATMQQCSNATMQQDKR